MIREQIRDLVVVSLSALAFACGNDDGKGNGNDEPMDSGVACNVESNFTSLYDNVFNTITCNSAGCHGVPEQGNFLLASDQDTVHAALLADSESVSAPQTKRVAPNAINASFLWTKLNELGGAAIMPPSGKLSDDCELQMIKAWIESGAPNN